MKLKRKISNKPRKSLPQQTPDTRAFSYKTSVRQSEQPVGKKPASKSRIKQFVRHLPAWLAIAAMTISLGYVLTLNANVNLVSINADNNPLLRESSVYEKAAHELLSGSLTAKTKLTINKGNFIKAMKAKFPELSEISVTLPLMGHRPIVKIGSNRPVVALQNDQGQLYAIDKQGRALMALDGLEQVRNMRLLLLKDQSTTPVTLGRSVITSQDAAFMAEIATQFNDKKVIITTLTLPTVANELHVGVEGKGYIVKFSTLTDARQSAGAYLALKDKLEKENVSPAEYIDLRVEEKAYIK